MTQTLRPLVIGDVYIVKLPYKVEPPGREQIGRRPAVVVGVPDNVDTPRYPGVLIVPLTSQVASWAKKAPKLYPLLKGGTNGLTSDSVVLLDHTRGIDINRLGRYLSTLTKKEYEPIKRGLEGMCKVKL